MSYEFYRILHLISVFGTLMVLGSICMVMVNGGNRNHPSRKFAAITHGIGIVVILVAGMGLVARLHLPMAPPPNWLIAKLVIWLLLGGAPALIYRKPGHAKTLFAVIWLLAAIAATLCVLKPA